MKQGTVPWFKAAVHGLTARRGRLTFLRAGQDVSPGKVTVRVPAARRASLPFGRAGQDVSPGKTRQKTPEPIALMLYGCDAFVHRRQTPASHPESIMALVSCIFLRQWSCPGIHPALHGRRLTKPGERSDHELQYAGEKSGRLPFCPVQMLMLLLYWIKA